MQHMIYQVTQYHPSVIFIHRMTTASNGIIFRITGPLCGEFTGHRWIPRTKASDAELWCFLYLCLDGWANNCEAGDLRRHHAHYDVIVMDLKTTNGNVNEQSRGLFCQHIWFEMREWVRNIYGSHNFMGCNYLSVHKSCIVLYGPQLLIYVERAA